VDPRLAATDSKQDSFSVSCQTLVSAETDKTLTLLRELESLFKFIADHFLKEKGYQHYLKSWQSCCADKLTSTVSKTAVGVVSLIL